MDLVQSDDSVAIRSAALLGLAKQPTPAAQRYVQAVAGDLQKTRSVRAQAIRALGYRDSASTVEFLIQLTKQMPSHIHVIHAALNRINSPHALSFMEEGLAQQEQRHQKWRVQRSTWKEELNDANFLDEKAAWDKKQQKDTNIEKKKTIKAYKIVVYN